MTPHNQHQFNAVSEISAPFSQVKALHNVQLVDVQRTGEDGVCLIVDVGGHRHELTGAGRWSSVWSRKDIGAWGYLEPARHVSPDEVRGSCHFRAYAEPTLRRVPELDDSAGNRGWACEQSPMGFVAPAHIVPGREGRFVRDETVEVVLRVPPEFVRECSRVQMTPEELLRGFVADASGISNYVVNPRADRFSSNGSDERDMAEAWINRAYGMNAVSLEQLDRERWEREEREDARDELGSLLDDLVDAGGSADDLMAAAQAMVNEQRAKQQP